ncbi:hypothetical protein [Methylobacterium sp. BTF04]|uniref:hypothetical protein n=1 Tax=Methylobacterium sp. BTF04 TaxID=2708300 RepID=UPI001FEFEF78|nr:hypothetical protein [Methylobacterium sp. BTF04]
MSLFERLFAPQRPVQQMAPAVQGQDDGGSYARRSLRRASVSRRHLRIRYAALHNAEPLQLRVADRQKPLDMKAGAAAAFLKDETLRPGDIVVLKDGIKVFVGRTDGSHAPRDFEAVGRSDFVDRQTRLKLAAMTMPVGAMPADAARKAMARVRSLMPATTEPTPSEVTAMRVINPWKMEPAAFEAR